MFRHQDYNSKGKRNHNDGFKHVLAYEPPDETWVPGRLRKF